jgi:acylphosphatase
LIARKYIVRGRVQGVGFRWFVEREASALGMAGWVKNKEDSTVELVAFGDDAKHAELRAKLAQGPRASRVDRVDELEATQEELQGNLKSFTIQGGW